MFVPAVMKPAPYWSFWFLKAGVVYREAMTVLQMIINMLYQRVEHAAVRPVCFCFKHDHPQKVWNNFMDLAAFVFLVHLKAS